MAGEIPPVTSSYLPRQETGLSLPGLTAGRATVLVPAGGTRPGPVRPGGTGKTTLACALAHGAGQAAELVLWVTATGRDAVISGYAQALAELDGAGHPAGRPEQAAERLLDRLAAAERPWLVVLDDLTGSPVVDGLCPAGPAGRVLITTSQPDAAAAIHGAEVVPVGAFSPREAMTYLSASLRTDPGQRTGALDLATELGFEPAPLSLAAAAMASTGLDCRQYLDYFGERRQALGRSFSSPSAAVLAAAWSLSCELADQFGPGGMARRVLALISMLAPHGIPGAVLTSEAARAFFSGGQGLPADHAQLRAALGGLARAGLVTVNEASPARTVLVHEAVQALARQHMTTAECEQAAQAAADALVQAWPGEDAGSPVHQALRDSTWKLREIAGTFLWQPQCHPVLVRAGQSLDAAGLTGLAVAYWEAMLGTAQEMLGADHPQTAAARGLLGAACEASGRFDEAISVYEAALGDTEQALGSGHPDTQNAGERLLHGYLSAERRDEAIGLAEKMLAEREQALGPDHPDTLAACAELASTYLAADRPAEACGTFARLLAGREGTLGRGHPGTIAAQTSLADAYTKAGRPKDAIALGKRALADAERAQGAGHPATTAARAGLAAAYRAAGKHKESLRLYERVLADREEALGPGHPDTIRARRDVGLSYLWLRKFKLAIVTYERAAADAERALGGSHPITGQARQDLAEAAAVATSVLGIDLRSAGRG